MSARPIIITGFMAAGKTTVAAALARRLSRSMIDLDEFIAKSEGRTAQGIIDEGGEQHFREIESKALRDALETEHVRIIALGGGAWMIPLNRALIKEHEGFTVLIHTSLQHMNLNGGASQLDLPNLAHFLICIFYRETLCFVHLLASSQSKCN